MKRILKSPIVNAVGLGVLTAFYTFVFMLHTGNTDFKHKWLQYYEGESPFWKAWSSFVNNEHHIHVAIIWVVLTVLVVVLLLTRRRPYDEYHTTILTYCLAVAAVLTLAAIAVFYLIILSEPIYVAGKFTLFITVHWSTVVLADLVYVLLCRWR